MERTLRLKLAELGLTGGQPRVEGATVSVDGDVLTLRVTIPAMGHQLVKVQV